jgi:hypothetical protein
MTEPKAFGGAQWINRADVDELLADLARVQAELEAARPVVDAADAWRDDLCASKDLAAAVDLHRSATSDHPSTTEEKP